MPLASSRSASQQRAAQVAAEQAKQLRRHRLSLPSTIDSTTVVTESKALRRRRRSRSNSNASQASSLPSVSSPLSQPNRKKKKTIAVTELDMDVRKENKPNGPSTSPSAEAPTRGKPRLPPHSPGVTPYWQVAQERGGKFTPPETRSASKKKDRSQETEGPPAESDATGLVLVFSPPNQAENDRREKERSARQQAERARRVEEARRRGQLLVFSPSHRPIQEPQDHDDDDDRHEPQLQHPVEGPTAQPPPTTDQPTMRPEATTDSTLPLEVPTRPPSSADSKAASSTSQLTHDTRSQGRPEIDPDRVVDEIQSLRETMTLLQHEQLQAGSAMEERWHQQVQKLMQHDTVAQTNARLLQANEQLQARWEQAQQEATEVKIQHKVELARLEAEVLSSGREYEFKMQALKEAKEQAEKELEALQLVKSAQEEQSLRLQLNLNAAQTQLVEIQARWAEEKQQRASEKAGSEHRYQQLELRHRQLLQEQESLQAQCRDLETRANLSDSLKKQVEELELKNEEERLNFQQLNESSAKAMDSFRQDMQAKDQKIGELFKQLGELQQEYQAERAKYIQSQLELNEANADLASEVQAKLAQLGELSQQLHELGQECEAYRIKFENSQQELQTTKEELAAKTKDLTAALEDALNDVVSLGSDKKSLVGQLNDAKSRIKKLESESSVVQSQLSGTSSTVNELRQDLDHERTKRGALEGVLSQVQRQLKSTTADLATVQHEREEARRNMVGFDEREDELLRKLRESDRIRREMHNRIMQLMGNIRVFVRVRPFLPHEINKSKNLPVAKSSGSVSHDGLDQATPFRFPVLFDKANNQLSIGNESDDPTKNIIEVHEPFKDRGGLKDRRKKWRYGFDKVFTPENGQDDVWDATEPLIQSAVDGYNVTIFAYGQTGSGKSFTMLGGERDEGVIKRAVQKLFDAKRETEAVFKGDAEVRLSVELLEIYNEKVRDLLATDEGPDGKEIPVVVTSQEVVGNRIEPVASSDQVAQILALAQGRRCVKATLSNSESSRSHMIFTIHFHVVMKNGVERRGKLNVCDLAGSERLSKSGAHMVGGSLLDETKHINKSLSALSNVIEKLQAGEKIVPFRESKLTFLLKDSLSGNSKTLAIICCSPSASHTNESICSLRFAEKVSRVDLKAVANFSC